MAFTPSHSNEYAVMCRQCLGGIQSPDILISLPTICVYLLIFIFFAIYITLIYLLLFRESRNHPAGDYYARGGTQWLT